MENSSLLHILAHRGWWEHPAEKNGLVSCERALSAGYGIEIDLRDNADILLVAHDARDEHAYPFEALCRLLRNFPGACVAINIKSCGLQSMLKEMLAMHRISHYFTFDMAMPDLLANLASGLISFTRQSDYETVPLLYERSHGVWLDSFAEDWLTEEHIHAHLDAGKHIALVSPELHAKPYGASWQRWRNILQRRGKLNRSGTIYLCTDHPKRAHDFFNSCNSL